MNKKKSLSNRIITTIAMANSDSKFIYQLPRKKQVNNKDIEAKD